MNRVQLHNRLRIKKSAKVIVLIFALFSLGLSGCYFEPPVNYGSYDHHDHDR